MINLSMSLLRNIKNIRTLFSDDVEKLAQLNEIHLVSNIKMIKEYLNNLIESKK